MLWIGLIIALFSGLAGIGLSREGAKQRFPQIKNLHLDWIAIASLVIGLAISAFDHLSSERKIESLEESSHKIRSFEISFDIQFTSEWKAAPPKSPRVMVMGNLPVAKVDIAQKTGSIRSLDLYMDKEPSFGPNKNGWVHTTYRVKAEPGSWLIASDAREQIEIRKLTFVAYGVRLQDSKDGVFTIGSRASVFINGRQATLLEFSPQSANLSKLPLGNNNPEMSFNGHWTLKY
jgi:hypothetical protein